MAFGSESNNAKEIGEIWKRLAPIEKKVSQVEQSLNLINTNLDSLSEKIKAPSESEAVARTAAQSATTYRTNIRKMKEEIKGYLDSIEDVNNWICGLQPNIDSTVESLNTSKEQSIKSLEVVRNIENDIEQLQENIEVSSNKITVLLEENNVLPEKLDMANSNIEEINELEQKAQQIVKNIGTYHSKVRELRDDILGYEIETDTGEKEYIEGIKDELTTSYDNLKKDYELFHDELEEYKDSSHKSFGEFSNKSENRFNEIVSEYKTQYDDVYDKIMKLLPDALTAGLSSAYDKKVLQEKEELKGHKTTFSKAITALVLISVIPFGVDAYLFLNLEKDILSVISDTPKIILSILPLYFPILWIAYSASKKANLSKRLIEEYTHKGVLSKTFEGLSTQIEELNDSDLSNELRVKLLFNILSVNAENPGKLISDYKTTDHPLMDALDKSVKLGNAVDKLRNIPGFSKLVTRLDNESQSVLAKAEAVADKGLNGESKLKGDGNV